MCSARHTRRHARGTQLASAASGTLIPKEMLRQHVESKPELAQSFMDAMDQRWNVARDGARRWAQYAKEWMPLAGTRQQHILTVGPPLYLPTLGSWPATINWTLYPPERGQYSAAYLEVRGPQVVHNRHAGCADAPARLRAQLLRGASSEPLWPDLDAVPAEQQLAASPEGFAFFPWWVSTSWGNRGMPGFWALDPPAQVRRGGVTLGCAAAAAGLPSRARRVQVIPHLVATQSQKFVWQAVRAQQPGRARPRCTARAAALTPGSLSCRSTAGTTGRWTTRLPAPRTQTPSSCRPPRRRACWPWRPGWGGTPRPRRSFGAWRCRCGGGGVRGGGGRVGAGAERQASGQHA